MRERRVEAHFRFEASRLAAAEGRADASQFRCPICLRAFTRQHLLAGELTLEHAVSRRLGGRILTITCRRCDNRDGSRLEKNVVEAVRSRDAFAGHGTIRATVHVGDAVFEAEVAWRPEPSETNVITVIGAASDPKQVETAMKYLESGAREVALSSSLGYTESRLWRGLLRAAYLVAFHHHGYSYVLAPSVAPIRRQITGEDAPSPYLGRVVTEIAAPALPPNYGFLEVDLGPKTGHSAYLVLLQPRMVLTMTYAVLLPHAGPTEEDVLARLASVAGAIRGSTLTIQVKGKRR